MKNSKIWSFLIIATMFLFSADGFIYTASANQIDDPNNVKWASIRGYSSDKFGEYFKKKSAAGYRIIDIEVDKINGQTMYSAVWQYNSDKRKWSSRRNMTHEEYSAKWKNLRAKGYRLIDQEAYRLGNKDLYAAVWVKNTEKLKWASFRNVSSSTFSKKFKNYRDKGYRMTDIEAYKQNGTMKYAGIFVQNKENLGWSARRDMSAAGYGNRFKDMRNKGYRVTDIESYRVAGKQKFAAIWVKNKNKRGWKASRDMSAAGFGNKWRTLVDEGYRLTDFEAYPTNNGTKYAGIWRQNGSKLNWPHKKDIDKAVKTYKDKNGIPGMSVAVSENGKIVYARGFGHADLKNNKKAHAGTIYRLASVSKPITMLTALRLVEKNKLDLDKKTRSYAPSLPSHHTHTIRQLIKHKSGVRHYKGSNRDEIDDCPIPNNPAWKDSSNKTYKTSKDAATLFQNDPLMYSPGAKTCYSTHAYTLLGAGLEGAGNKSFTKLVSEHLSSRLGLPTLRPENLDNNLAERSKIYDSKTNELDPQHKQWKKEGGGMESSVKDLTKLGIAVNNATAVKESTRKKIWTGSNFSYGGAQTGAKSYWRMYFNDDKVISILSNRKNGSPSELAKEIAGFIN